MKFTPNSAMLMVFLNNIGTQYQHTPHNVSMYYLQAFAKKYELSFNKFSQHSSFAKKTINSRQVLFLQPLTFMNNSGVSIAEIASFYRVDISNIIVFHDDIDLKETEIKTKQGGGSGGNNGLKSADSHISNLYTRLRIGVGKPPIFINENGIKQKTMDSGDFVLKKMSDSQITLHQQKVDIFMQKHNLLLEGFYGNFNAQIVDALAQHFKNLTQSR